jgi:glycosyltransferase involved in cell wall biosynthesis
MKSASPSVLLVSKPLAPPWNDGSKNLARELAEGAIALEARRVHGFVPRGAEAPSGLVPHTVPGPSLDRATAASMLTSLATSRGIGLWHFVSAPTARTSRVARALATIRRRRTVQTIASAPPDDVRLGDVVFADRVVVLSRATRARAIAEGVEPSRLRLVPIAISPPPPPSAESIAAVRAKHALGERVVITFPGDLEHGAGAERMLEACARMAERASITLVLACRDKTQRASARREELARRARAAAVDLRTIGETPSIHALLAASDVIALPTDSLYAKVDHPLVLLEAMHLGRPVLVSRGTAAHELAEDGGALGADFDAAALASALDRLAREPAWRAHWSACGRALVASRTVREMALAHESIYSELSR